MFKYHCVFERIILKFVISSEIDFEIGNFWKFYIYIVKKLTMGIRRLKIP